MKNIICALPVLLLPAIAFSQVQISQHLHDSSVRFTFCGRTLATAPVTCSATFQDAKRIPANFYAQHLQFFCRQELKMQQIHVPLAFRVGTMDQCNYLEQKPGYKIN